MKKKLVTEKQSQGILVRLTRGERVALGKYARKYKMSLGEAMRSAAAEKLFYTNH